MYWDYRPATPWLAYKVFEIKLNAFCMLDKQVLYQFTASLALIFFLKKCFMMLRNIINIQRKECWLQFCGNSKKSLNITSILCENQGSLIRFSIQLNNSWNINEQENTLVPNKIASSRQARYSSACGKEMLLWWE